MMRVGVAAPTAAGVLTCASLSGHMVAAAGSAAADDEAFGVLSLPGAGGGRSG